MFLDYFTISHNKTQSEHQNILMCTTYFPPNLRKPYAGLYCPSKLDIDS